MSGALSIKTWQWIYSAINTLYSQFYLMSKSATSARKVNIAALGDHAYAILRLLTQLRAL